MQEECLRPFFQTVFALHNVAEAAMMDVKPANFALRPNGHLVALDLPTPINIQQIAASPQKNDRRTRRGKKQNATGEIKPSYETRKEPLEYSTIDNYITKADILQRFFTKKSLSPILKAELRKLLNDILQINEDLIISEMSYINNVEPTINN